MRRTASDFLLRSAGAQFLPDWSDGCQRPRFSTPVYTIVYNVTYA